ncbi:nucleolar rRNA processing protein [Fusarium heterosporum]|uniref:Nucleolar rRNA processing protein n=1 Tax=Fusarium heterosporum TaxID=42747 RepID=A0A8H5WZY9_FUSHE|nr:nucleolar rRNA processing protein [Fusarium heterosporum]
MASAFSAYHGPAAVASQHTITALGRWSILNQSLPAVDKIKSIHVYDFDNTLFKTPLPNPQLWNGPTIGTLSNQETFINGGWWHDSRILASTGQGLEIEEKRAWEGWWNDKIVDLVKLSMLQKDALCVLLTGRSERGFAELIKKMVAAKGLEFDMVGLKPTVSPSNQKFQSTMHFKQLFLGTLMETYKEADEIRVYEDRPKHTKGFRDFFAEFNRQQNMTPTRGPIMAEVIQVADCATTLDPVVEVAEIQHMINIHNEMVSKQSPRVRQHRLRIKKTVFFTGYMIGPEDTKKLIKLAHIPQNMPQHELKYHGNNILICPRPCPASILDKVGGMGSKMNWEVIGTACFENSIWAAQLRPIPQHAKFHTDNPSPLVVLALRKGVRPMDAGKIQNWQPLPPEETFSFETVVGEKIILRIEPEDPREDEYESLFANKASKRKHNGDEDWNQRNTQGHYSGRNESRGYHSGGRGGRGRGNRGHRGNARGGRGGRGRGGGYNYRSLDDVEPKNQQGGYGTQVDYDDTYPPLGKSNNPPVSAPSGPGQSQGHFSSRSQQPHRGQAVSQGRPMGSQVANNSDLQNYY